MHLARHEFGHHVMARIVGFEVGDFKIGQDTLQIYGPGGSSSTNMMRPLCHGLTLRDAYRRGRRTLWRDAYAVYTVWPRCLSIFSVGISVGEGNLRVA